MEVPNKKTSAVVSALMVVAALVGVGIGLLCGNFGIKPPGTATTDNTQVAPGENLLLPEPENATAEQIAITRNRLTRIRSAIEDYALGNGGRVPDSLQRLVTEEILGAKALTDAWGRTIQYTPKGEGYSLRSLGPDGVTSADDVTP